MSDLNDDVRVFAESDGELGMLEALKGTFRGTWRYHNMVAVVVSFVFTGVAIWIEELGASRAAPSVMGWDGDRVAVGDCGAEDRLVWVFVMDSEAVAEGMAPVVEGALETLRGRVPRLAGASTEQVCSFRRRSARTRSGYTAGGNE